MSIRTEFLFMIADTKPDDDKILMELEKSVDGENVAFIYNSSTLASTCNVRFSFSEWEQIMFLSTFCIGGTVLQSRRADQSLFGYNR